jgi:hypothetical protein
VPNTGRIGDKSIGYPLRGMSAGLIYKETLNHLWGHTSRIQTAGT